MNQFLVAVIVALELHAEYCSTNLQDASLSMVNVVHKKSHRKGGFSYRMRKDYSLRASLLSKRKISM